MGHASLSKNINPNCSASRPGHPDLVLERTLTIQRDHNIL